MNSKSFICPCPLCIRVLHRNMFSMCVSVASIACCSEVQNVTPPFFFCCGTSFQSTESLTLSCYAALPLLHPALISLFCVTLLSACKCCYFVFFLFSTIWKSFCGLSSPEAVLNRIYQVTSNLSRFTCVCDPTRMHHQRAVICAEQEIVTCGGIYSP